MTEFQNITIDKKFKEIQVPTETIFSKLHSQTHQTNQNQRYQSKYNSLTRQFYDSAKKSHQSMGYANVPLKTPQDFLKRHAREANVKAEIKHFRCLDRENKKPPVPKRDEVPTIVEEDDKRNFMELNRLNAVRKPARKPAIKCADNRRGDTFFLEFSGLVPKFTRKKEFGKTPKYLVQRMKDISNSKEAHTKPSVDSKLILLTNEERSHLLEGLRTNWEHVYKKYMTLPLKIDTKSMITKKLQLERQLDLLEHDIHFLEKNEENDIYVLPD